MKRAKWYLVIAVMILTCVVANAAITAFMLSVSSTGDLSGCNQSVTTSGLCLAAPASGGILVGAWVNGGSIVQIYPSTSSGGLTSFNGRTVPAVVPTQGDYSFSQLSNPPTQLSITCPAAAIGPNGLSVPTSTPCTITLLK